MKKTISARTVVLLPGIARVAISNVLSIIRLRLGAKPRNEREQLQGRVSDSEMARTSFLEFCRKEKVLPVAATDHGALLAYAEKPEQDCDYEISVEEFSRFARTHGIEVTFNTLPTSDLAFTEITTLPATGALYQSLQEFCRNPVPESQRGSLPADKILVRLGGHGGPLNDEKDGDDWGGEVEKAFAASELKREEKRKKARLKKGHPGKAPYTRMGKLVVEVAWGIQVKTGKEATSDQVMTRLIEMAGNGEYDWLLESFIDAKGMAAVRWLTVKGIRKPYGHGACERALLEWKNSLK